jgi:hypothetical protein
MNTPNASFDHERLIAYQRSIQFVAWSAELLEALPGRWAVSDQLERVGKAILVEVVALLVGLIRSFSADRLGEAAAPYRTTRNEDRTEAEQGG